ncbi:hypothetical protein ACLB2K_011954 [Fragaria x ananassa]
MQCLIGRGTLSLGRKSNSGQFRGNVSCRAYYPVAWKKCCASLKEGGLGVRNIMALNQAFVLKKFWDFLTKSTTTAAFFSARFLQCSVGNGHSIDFWHGNWLNGSIIDKLGIEYQLGKSLCGKVSDFILNGSWFCSTNLNAELAALWSEILAIQLPSYDTDDKLVWLDSSEGVLSLSIAYEFKRNDILVQWGFSFASMCSLCHASVENSHHLFFECSFSLRVWGATLSLFGVNSHFSDIPLQHGFGTQLQLLWWGMMGVGFYSIWDARNSIRFRERRSMLDCLIHSIKLQIREIDSWGLGTMHNLVGELCIFSALGIKGRASRSHQIREVHWHAPSAFQVKVNTDDAAHGTLGLAGFGGIF